MTTQELDRVVSKFQAKYAQPWEHSPLLCGMSEETDCPACLLKYWPLRRQNAIHERLEASGISYEDLAELLLRPIQKKIEKTIRLVIDDNLREQQISLLHAFREGQERDLLREFLRELLFDDVVAIAEAVVKREKSYGRNLRNAHRQTQEKTIAGANRRPSS